VLIVVLISFSFAHAMDIMCNFKMSSIIVVGNIYICDDPWVVDFGDGKTLTSVDGVHLEGKNNDDIEGFQCGSIFNTLAFTPNLFDFFPNLRFINWQSITLNTISSSDIHLFSALEVIAIRYTQIVSIDGDLFQQNPKLRYISLAANQIQHVGENLLANLPLLEIVNFEGNICLSTIAMTQDSIQELNRELPIQCPPLITTEPPTTTTTWTPQPEYCPADCSERFGRNEHEISTLKAKQEAQNKAINELNVEIVELKRQVRELMASPCSCSP
jgi:Leucine rich repeat